MHGTPSCHLEPWLLARARRAGCPLRGGGVDRPGMGRLRFQPRRTTRTMARPRCAAKRITVLADRSAGKVLVVVRFGSEADLRKGTETLESMNPPGTGMRRVSVDYTKSCSSSK